MITVTGIFNSTTEAQRAHLRLQSMITRDKITLLSPGDKAIAPKSVQVIAAEQPGMGKAIGGVAGAAPRPSLQRWQSSPWILLETAGFS